MTIGPTPRVSRAWDWLTGVHSQNRPTGSFWVLLLRSHLSVSLWSSPRRR